MATWTSARKVFLAILSIGISASGQIQNHSREKVYSQILNEERTISIFLPEGYETSEKTYPILYILDAEGDRIFPKSVSTVMDLNARGFVPEMIVVGICNTNRNRDMIPESVAHRPGSGGSENFLSFIHNELMPYIQRNYRSSDYSILYGMSNSALFAVYALLKKPETFDAVIASSPMIGHCPEYIQKKAEAFARFNQASDLLLYMIYGTEDSRRVTEFVPDFHNYLSLHTPKGFTSRLEILEGEGHVPDSSLARGLQVIFGRDSIDH